MINKIGLSTGCYYPRLTESIIKRIYESGVSLIELFINTHSEMSDSFIKEIQRQIDYYGISVCSVHPFTSFAETYLFFSEYPKRFNDGIEIYDRYYEIANMLGAKIVNFHGMRSDHEVPFEKYCDCYGVLYQRARLTGVTLSQENVRQYVCGDMDYIKRFSKYMGEDVAFTFDVKQAHMSGYDPFDFIEAVSDKLKLIHLNDFDMDNPCLLPGNGCFDFRRFIKYLKTVSFCGNSIIEVYSGNYSDENEIHAAVNYIKNIIKECCT